MRSPNDSTLTAPAALFMKSPIENASPGPADCAQFHFTANGTHSPQL